jgi:hypothetical protein
MVPELAKTNIIITVLLTYLCTEITALVSGEQKHFFPSPLVKTMFLLSFHRTVILHYQLFSYMEITQCLQRPS